MRTEVKDLLVLGPLPASEHATAESLARFESALGSIVRPVAQDEATELATLFGPDDCFGLVWTLLHLVESAPDLKAVLDRADASNTWVREMMERLDRAG